MKQLLLVLSIFAMPLFSSAQDVIKQKNGEELEVKIIELADDYVKFYYFEDPDKVEIVMNRSLIREIDFEYGRKETEIDPGLNESYFVDDKRGNILANFTAFASNTGSLAYERSLDPNSSIGGVIKLHGVGANTGFFDDRSGFGIEANYKVKTGNIFKKNDYRPRHLLQGGYLRPNLGFSTADFTREDNGFGEDSQEYSFIYGGFDIGKQWVFNNTLSLDIFTGINFFGGSFEETFNGEVVDDPLLEINDGNLAGGDNVGVRYGVQLGFLLN